MYISPEIKVFQFVSEGCLCLSVYMRNISGFAEDSDDVVLF